MLPPQRSMHPYPKHLDSFEYRGAQRYFLTFCTHDRVPLFTTAEHVALVRYFLSTVRQFEFADLVHCFMPDHLHTAIERQTPAADLRSFASRMKQYTGFYFKKEFGQRLWQHYGYEHIIRSEETTSTIVRYVLENPIRGGLASNVDEYPFIGSSEYTREQLIEFACLPSKGGSYKNS
jgi:REP element-mobilizing transposase RayT